MPIPGLLADDLREEWARPLLPGEFRKNPNGSVSTEIEITVEDEALNGGKPTNIPSLWMTPSGIIEADFEQAIDLARKSGLLFPSFTSVDDAVNAAEERSGRGAVFSGPLSPTQQKDWTSAMRNFLKPKV
jgi:hypothetical protein